MTQTTFWKIVEQEYEGYVSYVKSKGIQDAEEVVHDTLVSINPNNLRGASNPKGWIMAAIKQGIAYSQRKRFALRERECPLSPDLGYSPEEKWIAAIAQETFVAVLQKSLSQTEYKLLSEHYLGGKSIASLAKERRVSEGAIKSRLARIRERVRRNVQI